MKNVTMSVKGKILTITCDVSQDHGPSASGKTTVIATTAGSVSIPDHPEIKLGLNLYKKQRS